MSFWEQEGANHCYRMKLKLGAKTTIDIILEKQSESIRVYAIIGVVTETGWGRTKMWNAMSDIGEVRNYPNHFKDNHWVHYINPKIEGDITLAEETLDDIVNLLNTHGSPI